MIMNYVLTLYYIISCGSKHPSPRQASESADAKRRITGLGGIEAEPPS